MARHHALLAISRATGFALASIAAHTVLALSLPLGTVAKLERVSGAQMVWLEAAGALSAGASQQDPRAADAASASSLPSGQPLRARRAARRIRPVAPALPTASTSREAADVAVPPVGQQPSEQGAAPLEGDAAVRGAQALFGAAQGTSTAGAGVGAGAPARGPGLLAARSPCAGYYPRSAQADQGEVKIEVQVDPSGRTRASTVLDESPRNQGFASAARACAERLRFAPALSAGSPVSGRATLRLTFRRG